jgi:hypothetical protein
VTRRVAGYFDEGVSGDQSPSSLAPFLLVRFGDGTSDQTIAMLIDTGADTTALGPRDALALLGRDYLRMDFDHGPGVVAVRGFGEGDGAALVTPMELWLRDTDGIDFPVLLNVAITKPSPAEPGHDGNWMMPSLLGRDILDRFDLTLSYNPPSVTLTEAEPA